MKLIAVSSCFLLPTRYDGRSAKNVHVTSFLHLLNENGIGIIPFCPEQLGGLPTPRTPAEIQGEQVFTQDGKDITKAFKKGAQISLDLLKYLDISVALVKQKSPSCGFGKIYDGNFNGTLVSGKGVTSQLLHQNNITLYTEEDLHDPDIILETHF